jgi:hypothetical protein
MSRRFSRAQVAVLIVLQILAVWLPTVVFLRMEGTWPVGLGLVVVLVAVHVTAAKMAAMSAKKAVASDAGPSPNGAAGVSPAA